MIGNVPGNQGTNTAEQLTAGKQKPKKKKKKGKKKPKRGRAAR
jgi:hypothetical protein